MEDIKRSLKKNIEDILFYNKKNSIEMIFQTVFESILKAERNDFLKETSSLGNKGNGYYPRMARSINNYFKLNVPRDRLSLFQPVFLEVIKQQDEQLNDLAFKLYTQGLTTRDINETFQQIYGKSMSSSSVSNITKEFQQIRESWQERPLKDKYYFIYIDAIFIPVRRDTVEKEAFYIVMGLKPDLKREVLGVYNIPVESSEGWRTVFYDLKQRGLQQCLMVIADGLSGLKEVVREVLPQAKLQKCLVHKVRNILYMVRTRDKTEVTEDFRNVFKLEDNDYDFEQGVKNLNIFLNKWKKKYPSITRKFHKNDFKHYFAYLDFPASAHRMIYTTNWIERLNKGIKRTTKIRNSFPNPDSALNLIVAYLMDFEQRVYKYPVSSFIKIKDTLDDKFYDLRHN